MELSTMIEAAIGAMLTAVIIAVLAPTVFNQVNTVTSNATYIANDQSAVSIFGLLPLFFAIIGIVLLIGFIAFRRR